MDIISWTVEHPSETRALITNYHHTVLPEYSPYREHINERLAHAARGDGDGIISDLANFTRKKTMPSLPETPRVLVVQHIDGQLMANVLVTIPGLPIIQSFGLSHRFVIHEQALAQCIDSLDN